MRRVSNTLRVCVCMLHTITPDKISQNPNGCCSLGVSGGRLLLWLNTFGFIGAPAHAV